jgi:hypothetical protein
VLFDASPFHGADRRTELNHLLHTKEPETSPVKRTAFGQRPLTPVAHSADVVVSVLWPGTEGPMTALLIGSVPLWLTFSPISRLIMALSLDSIHMTERMANVSPSLCISAVINMPMVEISMKNPFSRSSVDRVLMFRLFCLV